MATPQELIQKLNDDPRILYEWMLKKGYRLGWKNIGGWGISYYIRTPDGQAIVPTRDGIVKKRLNDVKHYEEGWISDYDPHLEQLWKTQLYKPFIEFLISSNALPEWI